MKPAPFSGIKPAGDLHRFVTPLDVHNRLDGKEEWAFIDVREQGAFDQGHPFWASNAPLSHLERVLPELVPRQQTPLVLMDDADDGLARRAQQRLNGLGYTDVTIMQGGLQGWRESQLPFHTGIHVPSKAFGEFVEHHHGTPCIDVQQLKELNAQGQDLLLVDCRPFEEYKLSTLPGSINCPGMDLLTRVPGMMRSRDTMVVVHCAGRTRGIIGAQTLIHAQVAQSVVTLTNGMAGWILNGGELSHGNIQIAAKADPRVLGKTRSRVSKLAHDAGLKVIDLKQLEQLKKQAHRSLFLFDVRTPEEFQTAQLPGFRLAPGGQLLQSLDAFVGTRGSRIVLCDDDGVRARMTGYWLKQMGWDEIFVLEDPIMASLWTSNTQTSKQPSELAKAVLDVPKVQASVLQAQMAAGEAVVIDLSDSLKFGRSHIPGAWFGVRARLNEALTQIPAHRVLVLTSEDGDFAAFAWAEAQALSKAPVFVLSGGNRAWVQAGFPMASGRDRMTTLNDDVWYSPLERPDPIAAIHEYLRWEIGLNDHLAIERGIRFQEPITKN